MASLWVSVESTVGKLWSIVLSIKAHGVFTGFWVCSDVGWYRCIFYRWRRVARAGEASGPRGFHPRLAHV